MPTQTMGFRRWLIPGGLTFLGLLILLFFLYFVTGPHEVRTKSEVNTYRLPLHGPIYAAGSDFRAFMFRVFDLPEFMKIARREFSHETFRQRFDRIKIDPSKLYLAQDSDVRVYFVG